MLSSLTASSRLTASSSRSGRRTNAAYLPHESRMRAVGVLSVNAPLPYPRTRTACRAAAAVAQQQLTLHIGETTIQLPFTPAQAQQLDAELAKLLQTFADKQAAKRPKRWDMMEVRFTGPEAGQGMELLEVFCNPNAHATAFDAKLLVTVKAAGGLNVMSEGRLSAIKADLDAYLSAQ